MAQEAQPTKEWNDNLTTEPVEEGAYFIKRQNSVGNNYSYWDGKEWKRIRRSLEAALETTERSTEMYHLPRPWCGAK